MKKELEIERNFSVDEMTMRDVFALFAMNAFLLDESSFSETAHACYRMADAMLKERSK